MPLHDYSPREALDLLLQKVTERDPELARHLQSVIDSGKDVWERDYSGNRKKSRGYRKTVRFTDEEALRIATDGLQAHFVEQPLFITSAARHFAAAALGARADPSSNTLFEEQAVASTKDVGIEKQLEIELQTETHISRVNEQNIRLLPPAEDMLEQQKAHVKRLFDLVAFDQE